MGGVATAFLGLIVWGIKKLITTTFENTVQVKILTGQIATLLNLPPQVEKIKSDLNEAHNRIRSLKNGGTP